MRVTYNPEGGESHEWDYKPGKLMSAEAEAIERVTGCNYRTEFADKLLSGSALALRAILWVLLKREQPTLKFGDVDFAQDEADVDFDEAERAEMRALISDDPNISDDDKAEALAALGPVEDDADADPKADEDDPAST